jgi:hypothetical protein
MLWTSHYVAPSDRICIATRGTARGADTAVVYWGWGEPLKFSVVVVVVVVVVVAVAAVVII